MVAVPKRKTALAIARELIRSASPIDIATELLTLAEEDDELAEELKVEGAKAIAQQAASSYRQVIRSTNAKAEVVRRLEYARPKNGVAAQVIHNKQEKARRALVAAGAYWFNFPIGSSLRLGAARKADLLAAAEQYAKQADGNRRGAEFMRALAAEMPSGDVPVRDALRHEQVVRIAAETGFDKVARF